MDARLTLLLCVAVLEATVRLTDAAAPPVFTKPSAAETKNVDENTPIGTVVYTVEATDDDNDIITYSFHTDSEVGPLFAIDGSSGKVTVKAVLDFENLTVHSYKLKFVATAGQDAVNSVVVTVNITDVNEAPVFPPNTITEANVVENSAGGTSVCMVTATDTDTANTITYSLVTGSDQLVDVNAATGEVTVKDNVVLDHEADSNTFTIQIVATDNGSTQKSVTSLVIPVTIDNVDEAPVFPTTSATVEVLEGETAGIHTLPEATDPEGQTVTYSGSYVEGITYSVSASRIITASKAISYTNNNNVIEFKASDGNAEGIYKLTLNVKTAPAFTVPANNGVEKDIPENSVGGTPVYTVTANDADQDTVTYSFHDTDSEHGQLFVINSSNGEVTVKTDAVLDYEATNNFTLKFVATDKAGHSGTSESILVKLANVDEAPVFPTPSATVDVLEGATAGIHTLPEATDPEGKNVTYSVDEQNGITYTIDPTTRSISADPAISLSNDGNEVLFEASDPTNKTSTYTLTLNVKTGNEENGSVMLGVSTGLLLLMATCAAILA